MEETKQPPFGCFQDHPKAAYNSLDVVGARERTVQEHTVVCGIRKPEATMSPWVNILVVVSNVSVPSMVPAPAPLPSKVEARSKVLKLSARAIRLADSNAAVISKERKCMKLLATSQCEKSGTRFILEMARFKR